MTFKPVYRLLEVTQVADALETSFESAPEVVQTVWFAGLTFGGKVNSVPKSRNRLLKVTQLREVPETSEEGVAQAG